MSVHDRAAGYTLGALGGVDRLGFEAHLSECAACRDDVEDLVDAAELLSEGVELPVPGTLRERVLTAAAATPGPHAVPRTTSQSHAGPVRRRRWFG